MLDSLLAKIQVEDKPAPEKLIFQLQKFDPNTASISELENLGIPSFLSRRIKNYVNSGGTFQKPDDLKKIYDFPDSLYERLSPYVQLPESEPKQVESNSDTIFSKKRQLNKVAKAYVRKPRYSAEALDIDINKADTTEFKQLYGIGSGYASRIIKFREALGGYHSTDQLRGMYGMTDSLFYQIKSFLKVSDTVELKSININVATFKQLISHPYISYELTQEILISKSKSGKFRKVADLERLKLLHPDTAALLLPYLTF